MTAETTREFANTAFLRACRGEAVPHTPVWFMRQAGRSLPEYRALREGVPMLTACLDPAMVVEITLQPVRRYGVDAAIYFSDIVAPLYAAGFGVDIVAGVGPVVAKPISTLADVERIEPLDSSSGEWIGRSVGELVRALDGTPLIGFAGAPFTLASYLIEGGPSRSLTKTKALMRSDASLWHALLERLSTVSATFLRMQVEAGASAVQLFDSWVGALSARDYATFVAPHSARVLDEIGALGVPRIHFGVGTGELLADMARTGADVVGVDFRVPLDEAARRVGPGYALQGNLDPATCLCDWPVVEAAVRQVLDDARRAECTGHIFNLGHGVLPEIEPDVLARIVDLVHTATER